MSQDARYDEERATENRARMLGLDYTNTSLMTEKPLFKGLIADNQMEQFRVVPIAVDQSNLKVAITTTTSQQTMDSIAKHFNDQRVAFTIISDTGFREYMRLYNPPKKPVYHDITLGSAGQQELVERVSSMLDQIRADDVLAYLVHQAHMLFSSDIHIETMPDHVRVRFRIDGVLHIVARMSQAKYRTLMGAVATAANVSTRTDEAQQGHIRETVHMADGTDVEVNLRVETVPTINGMDVVMRLFNLDPEMYHLDQLGLLEDQRLVVDDIMSRPSGLVMVVGPTGSGKTTTLYSMLNTLNNDERKIITIEDPVEYQFDGITQISVRSAESGNDGAFADKLRAILRLDPDIVMIGEIRDQETARTALQAALTGHLVLCTFHASSASAALTRIGDILGQNPLFVSAIRLVMAQRLVRRLDDATKQPYAPTLQQLETIEQVFSDLPPGMERPNLHNLVLYHPGSSAENPYGFRGQIAVREQFLMTGDIGKLMEDKHSFLSTQSIEAAAKHSGMRTMIQDAMMYVVAGQTTYEEVFRVIG